MRTISFPAAISAVAVVVLVVVVLQQQTQSHADCRGRQEGSAREEGEREGEEAVEAVE